MTLELNPVLNQRLENLASTMHQSASEVAEKAITEYVGQMQELIASVQEAEESAERDGTLTTEEVMGRIHKRFRIA